jgi:hypothetical protein
VVWFETASALGASTLAAEAASVAARKALAAGTTGRAPGVAAVASSVGLAVGPLGALARAGRFFWRGATSALVAGAVEAKSASEPGAAAVSFDGIDVLARFRGWLPAAAVPAKRFDLRGAASGSVKAMLVAA